MYISGPIFSPILYNYKYKYIIIYIYIILYIYSSSILLDGKLIHLSCAQDGKEMVLLALPSEL